jgi:hypothetical protein
MQTLIQDLLAYSSEQIFKKEILKSNALGYCWRSKEDLEQDLRGKNS